jgi:formate-dependent nitrite reductase cytochrome c552 subunit
MFILWTGYTSVIEFNAPTGESLSHCGLEEAVRSGDSIGERDGLADNV